MKTTNLSAATIYRALNGTIENQRVIEAAFSVLEDAEIAKQINHDRLNKLVGAEL